MGQCCIDLETGKFYSETTGGFTSLVPLAVNVFIIGHYPCRYPFHMDMYRIEKYDLRYAKFLQWISKQKISENFFSKSLMAENLTNFIINCNEVLPTHVTRINTSFYKKCEEEYNINKSEIVHIGDGLIGIYYAEKATLLALYGFPILSMNEILKELDGSKGMFK